MASIEGYSLAAGASEQERLAVDLVALVGTYSALLFRLAHSVLRNRAEAEDVVQDVFVRVMQHRRQLESVVNMRVWLVRIAWNLAIDRRRKISPQQMDESFTETLATKDVAADQAVEEAQRMKSVLRGIDRLPAKERQALLLSAIEELSTGEIVAITGRSESAVRALIFRARTRLKERLER